MQHSTQAYTPLSFNLHLHLHHTSTLSVSPMKTTTIPSTDSTSTMEDKEKEQENYNPLPKLVSLQADIIYNAMVAMKSPFIALLSTASDSYHRAEETATNVETAVQKVPSKFSHGSTVMMKKIGFGLMGAAQVLMIMLVLTVLAAFLGIWFVKMWVEEPVYVNERLFFDYTNVNPEAVFFVGGGGGGGSGLVDKKMMRKQIGVPVGHTYYVSLVLLMPESDFNREIGVFQLTAEILSNNGGVIARSSQPCMLRFRSFPVQLARTFFMGVPFLLGIYDETQRTNIGILKHKEGNPRTGAVRVILSPRAGTSSLPQLYEAEIILQSRLPWTKQIVHNWKWTLYVWSSLYIYIMLIMSLICCCRPLFLPVRDGIRDGVGGVVDRRKRGPTREELREPRRWARYDKETSESLRRWQASRSKRKAIFLQESMLEPTTSSASASTTKVTMEDTSTIADEEIGDSESVCLGG